MLEREREGGEGLRQTDRQTETEAEQRNRETQRHKETGTERNPLQSARGYQCQPTAFSLLTCEFYPGAQGCGTVYRLR